MSEVEEKDGPNTELENSMDELTACQMEIDKINKMTQDEIFNLEQKFEELRQPLYIKRSVAIKRLPKFWGISFKNNQNLLEFMGKKGFRSIRKLEVENFTDIRSGYRIHLHFYENPYFENKVLTKEFHLRKSKNGKRNWIETRSTPIKWKKGMQYSAWPRSTTKTMYKNLFDWLLDNKNPDCDHIGDLIRDDLWINPLRYYCLEASPEDNNNEEKRELDDEQSEDSDDELEEEEESEDEQDDEYGNEHDDDDWNENDNLKDEEEDN